MIRTRAPRPKQAQPRRPTVTPDLDALADRVGRLRPCRHDPEAFHAEKDEIEQELRRLAQLAIWLAR